MRRHFASGFPRALLSLSQENSSGIEIEIVDDNEPAVSFCLAFAIHRFTRVKCKRKNIATIPFLASVLAFAFVLR